MPGRADPFKHGQTAQIRIGVDRRAAAEPTALLPIAIPFSFKPIPGRTVVRKRRQMGHLRCASHSRCGELLQRSLFLFSLRLSVGLQ